MTDQPTTEEVENLLDDIQHWRSIDDSRIPLKTRTILTALCNHYLAQAAAPQMTAGEFAGLVVGRLQQVINDYRNSGNDFGEWYVNYARARVLTIAREHNIEIVEPSKP